MNAEGGPEQAASAQMREPVSHASVALDQDGQRVDVGFLATAAAAVVCAREALEDGNHVLLDVLLENLEKDLAGAAGAAISFDAGRNSEAVCPDCGLDCEWPGRLADHARIVHGHGEGLPHAA